MTWKKFIAYLKKNKLSSSIIIILLLVSFYSYGGSTFQSFSSDESFGRSLESGEGLSADTAEVRTAYATIDSENAESDRDVAKTHILSSGGEVESENRHETDTSITITLSTRIPSSNFDSFIDWLNENYDVESSSLQSYEVDLTRIQGEIDALLEAIEIYDRLLERAEAQEDISAVQQITQAKLDALRQLRFYGYNLEDIREDESLSRVTLTFTEEKEIEIVPDDLGKEFKKKWALGLQEALDVLIGIVTGAAVLGAKVLKWIIYGIIIAVPVWLIYKYLLPRLKR